MFGPNRFIYGLRIRPYSIAAQPKGPIEYIDKDNVPQQIKDNFTEPDYRFGILVYPHELTDIDIDHYTLTNMNLISDKEAWERFVELAKEAKEKNELSMEDFIEYYIKPTGDYADRNPLYKGLTPKSNTVFDFLCDNGFAGSIKGLQDFYSEI